MVKCKALPRSLPIVTSRSADDENKGSACILQPTSLLRRRKVPLYYFGSDARTTGRRVSQDRHSYVAVSKSRNKGHSNKMMFVFLIWFSTATSIFGQTSEPPTQAPSPAVGITANPTTMPTFSMTNSTRAPTIPPQPTLVPTRGPTTSPTAAPSSRPTSSASPSVSSAPTQSPSITRSPSHAPSLSLSPSASPTQSPTQSQIPTVTPSVSPTADPTAAPSDIPSQVPTFGEAFFDGAGLRSQLLVSRQALLNETEQDLVSMLFESYTDDFRPAEVVGKIKTKCHVQGQEIVACSSTNPFCTDWGVNVSDPNSQEGYINFMNFFCNYSSTVTEVKGFPDLFVEFTEENGDLMTEDMQNLALPVIRAFAASRVITPSPTGMPVAAPSVSPSPTKAPKNPTGRPTFSPTQFPTDVPTTNDERSFPSTKPTTPPTFSPTSLIPNGGGDDSSAAVVAGVVVAVGVIALVGLFMFYRHRKKKNRGPMYSATISDDQNKKDAANPNRSFKVKPIGYVAGDDSEAGQVQALISPSESLVSKHSLISAPNSGIGDESDPEVDGTRNLQDEFDQYKDQNLDNFRSEVEGNMPGFEGVMSAAVTRALMGDDDHEQEIPEEAFWGCTGTPSGAEIEASALWEVDDWLKRNEVGALDRKRVFFADILNRMVTSVRFGIVQAEDASRTIHESAALLNLQLANELPMTTVIISGMRKNSDATHMLSVLRAFGDIDVAAVASRQKGFGIVRFRNPKSVDKVMLHYKKDEIEIQEVAVQVKALMPSGAVVGRNM